MAIREYTSPTGSLIVGTDDWILARADIIGIDEETGEPEYEGHTEVFWDTQTTRTRDRKRLFLDEDGNSWTFDQLTPTLFINDDDEPEFVDRPMGKVFFANAHTHPQNPNITPGWYYQIDMRNPVGPFATQLAAGYAARASIVDITGAVVYPGDGR